MKINTYTNVYLSLLILLMPCYCQSLITNHPGVTKLQSSHYRRISFNGIGGETLSDTIILHCLTSKKEGEENDDDEEEDDDYDGGEEDDDYDDEEENDHQSSVLDSIVKVYCEQNSEPDLLSLLIPWYQGRRQYQSALSSLTARTGRGFLIDIGGVKRIITNAHSVDMNYGIIIQVQRRGQSTRYQATIEALSNEGDLAILKVEDEEFWNGLESSSLIQV